MTPFDLTQCPPPEGWGSWLETKPATEWAVRRKEPREHVRVTRHGDTFAVSVMTSEEMYHGPWTAARDLPSAYRRALQAVGLASPWTSEVPTTPGLYAVVNADHTPVGVFVRDDGVPCWLGHDGRRHPGEFPNGARFCPCPQPPKEPG